MTQNTKFLIEETVTLSEKKDEARFLTYIEMLEKESIVEQYLILKSFKIAVPNTFHSTINMYKNEEGNKDYSNILKSIVNIKEDEEKIIPYVEYFQKLLPTDIVVETKSSNNLFEDLKPKTIKEINNSLNFYADIKGEVRKIEPSDISIYMDEGDLKIDYQNTTVYSLIKYNEDNGYFEGLMVCPCGFILFETIDKATNGIDGIPHNGVTKRNKRRRENESNNTTYNR